MVRMLSKECGRSFVVVDAGKRERGRGNKRGRNEGLEEGEAVGGSERDTAKAAVGKEWT